MSSCWLLSIPNEGNKDTDATLKFMKEQIACTQRDLSELYEFEIPSDLLVGTLDSLMSLSDEMHRIDMSIESVVRKIERQFQDLSKGEEALTVDGVPVDRYLNHFVWDEAKHPHRRPLRDIVNVIQNSMGKVDDELKQLSSMYAEKKQQLSLMTKKKGTNLLVVNLNEVLTPDVVSEKYFVNTEYLQTVVVIVPKNLEEQFLGEYATLGSDIANYGQGNSRSSVKGSPVVPNTARKLLVEGESILYAVTLLKGQYQAGFIDDDGNFEQGVVTDYVEAFVNKAREKRYVVREFSYNENAQRDKEKAKAELEVEVDRLWSGLLRWCKAHFGEAFIAWMHIKAVRLFTESVLRYGLPANFVVMLVRPHQGKDKKIHSVLSKAYEHLQPKEFAKLEETAANEFYPYVYNSFEPVQQ